MIPRKGVKSLYSYKHYTKEELVNLAKIFSEKHGILIDLSLPSERHKGLSLSSFSSLYTPHDFKQRLMMDTPVAPLRGARSSFWRHTKGNSKKKEGKKVQNRDIYYLLYCVPFEDLAVFISALPGGISETIVHWRTKLGK